MSENTPMIDTATIAHPPQINRKTIITPDDEQITVQRESFGVTHTMIATNTDRHVRLSSTGGSTTMLTSMRVEPHNFEVVSVALSDEALMALYEGIGEHLQRRGRL